MIDFLTKLAARAITPLPAIQPRAASRFEPAMPSAGPAGPQSHALQAELGHEESLDVDPRVGDGRQLPVPSPQKTNRISLPDYDAPSDHLAPIVPPLHMPLAWPKPPAVEVTPVIVPPPQVREEFVPAKAPAAFVAPSTRPLSAGRFQPEAVSVDEPGREVQRPRGKPLRHDTPADREASNALSTHTTLLPQTSPPAQKLFAPAVVVAPPVRSEPAAISRSLPSEMPPTIRITIGRVDVRAVTSPPTAPAASRKGPQPARLSLEDYLKHRSGDRR